MNHTDNSIPWIKMKLILVTIFAFCIHVIMAQDNNAGVANTVGKNLKISGVVRDAAGETIPGASIYIKNTNKGTISDLNGKFSIEVPYNETLTITMVGYQTQVVVVTKSAELSIVLAEMVKGLDEVVVIGYGTIKKKDLT